MSNADEPHTNKLNIYLVKQKYGDYDSATIIGQNASVQKTALGNIGVLYYERSHTSTPGWLKNFFLNNPAIDRDDFLSSGPKAVLLVKMTYKSVHESICNSDIIKDQKSFAMKGNT